MAFVQSKFAVLKIDNDDDERAAQRARDKQKAKEMNTGKNKPKDGKQKMVEADKNATKKKKASQEKAELKNLAFGLGKPVKPSGSKKTKKASNGASGAAPAPTEEWQQRYADLIEEDYEAQLQQSLLASKIEYQKKKEDQAHQLLEKESTQLEHEAISSNASKKSKKGTTTMSLDQFNQVPLSAQPSAATNGKIVNGDEEDEHFFENVIQEAKLLASREKRQAQAAKKLTVKSKQPTPSEAPRMAQLLEEFKQSQEEVDNLRQENETLREELTSLKAKSKRMCAVFLQGEMKEKAELIIEMEKLAKVKDELTAEVEKLSSELQQERSKVSALSDAKKNAAQKKKTDGDN